MASNTYAVETMRFESCSADTSFENATVGKNRTPPGLVIPYHPPECPVMTSAEQFPPATSMHQVVVQPIPSAFSASPTDLQNAPPTRRCTLPLLLCFLVPAMGVAAVFFAVSWLTLDSAATHSVLSVSDRLHDTTLLHLRSTVEQFLQRMVMVMELTHGLVPWDSAAAMGSNDSSVAIWSGLLSACIPSIEPYYLGFVRSDGLYYSARREANGQLMAGFVGPNSTSMKIWLNVNGSVPPTTPPSYSVAYNVRLSVWYQAMKTGSVFTPVNSASTGLSFGFPVTNPTDGSFLGVLAMSFQFDSLKQALIKTKQTLQTSGVLLLMDSSGAPIAWSSASAPLGNDRGKLLALPVPESGSATSEVELSEYGKSFVLHLSLSGRWADAFATPGIDWRLFLVIPEEDYFSTLNRQRKFEIGWVVGCIFSFSILLAIFFRVLLTMSFHRLIGQLAHLKELLETQPTTMTVAHAPFDSGHCGSRFSELAALHQGVVDVLQAAETAMEERAKELMQAREAEQMSEQMQRVMRSKEMFFAMMSHEMRTPLTACIGMAEILIETTHLDHRQRECAETISSNGTMLLGLVNDILDYRKLESGKLETENVPFCPREVCERAARVVQTKAEDKGLELVVHIQAKLPSMCVGDPTRLSQVLLNLLSNAVKFTHKGMVMLKCSVEADDANIATMHFSVIDTGIGLEASTIERLFQPFVQADASMARRYGGTGLGLVISKKLVELMGGQMDVHSQGENRGSEFHFTIPLVPIPVSPRTQQRLGGEPIQVLTPSTVVVVDDLVERREATCEMLSALSLSFIAIPTMEHLDGIALTSAPDPPVVLLHPPGEPAALAEFERLFAQLPEPLKPRHTVAVINIASEQLGGLPDAVFTYKPLTLAKLSTAIAAALEDDGPSHESSSASQQQQPPVSARQGGGGGGQHLPQLPVRSYSYFALAGPRILVVDDVIVNQRVLTLKLQQRGYTNIDLASSGLEALEMIGQESFVYRCILMDVMMPGMDGLEATRRIKTDPRYRTVPIIAVTGNCSPGDVQRCLEAGMIDVMAKPIDSGRLTSLMEQHVSLEN